MGWSYAPPQKIVKFYFWKCDILVHFLTIHSNHYLFVVIGPLGHGPCPLKYAFAYTHVQYTPSLVE